MQNLLRALALLPVLAHFSPADHGAEAIPAPPHPAAQLLPAGSHAVEVMTPQVSERQTELLLRFQKGAQKHRQWFLDYVRANAGNLEALPYHVNFGLSQEEYGELQTFLSESRLVVGGRATLKVSSDASGRLTLDGGDALSDLTGIVIDPASDRVTTPYGVAGPREVVEPGSSQKEIGQWSGFSWRFETPVKPEEITASSKLATIKLTLGRLQENGRGILTYRFRSMVGGKVIGGANYTLLYDLPAPSGGTPPAPAGKTPPAGG